MLVSSIQSGETAQLTAKAAASSSTAESASATKPYYFSPALVIDPKAGTAVLEYLNTSTGAVLNQYPSEKDIKAYTQTSAVTQATTAAIAKPAIQSVPATTDAKPAVASIAPVAISQTAVVDEKA